ncbi:Chemotaxis response regulator protein-glutamate methylesterase [bioreactor metagenome]|uniref:protein-glutamate methylesterase n=1 Tax=bioreactor metagenome TaxID=1076179 RepID=A0A644WV18_9ZZZZ
MIAVGASTGGTEAIYNVLRYLPPTTPGILIVQHIPPVFSQMFAKRLNDNTQLTVKEAQSGDLLGPGIVLVAPGDRHMRIKRVGGLFRAEVFEGPKRNGHCPSVDVLFESVAEVCGQTAVGVILTGMGEDGARGLLAMRKSGARTIGQDEKSCVVYGMPKAAYEMGGVERQSSLEDIPNAISSVLSS